MCLTKGHIFWCRIFRVGGVLVGVGVVWVRGVVGLVFEVRVEGMVGLVRVV